LEVIGVTLLTNFAEASNPVWAFLPANRWIPRWRWNCGAAKQRSVGFQAGQRMKQRMVVVGAVVTAQLLGASAGFAGPWEDGMAAYNRGDYVPAIRVFRALAEQGNAKAQNVLGVMSRNGEGVPKNPVRAHMWFSFAAKRGDAKAKAELRDMSRTMTAQEISQAEAMAQACEASGYRQCEY
jgi:TPR repeat protein